MCVWVVFWKVSWGPHTLVKRFAAELHSHPIVEILIIWPLGLYLKIWEMLFLTCSNFENMITPRKFTLHFWGFIISFRHSNHSYCDREKRDFPFYWTCPLRTPSICRALCPQQRWHLLLEVLLTRLWADCYTSTSSVQQEGICQCNWFQTLSEAHPLPVF